MDAINRLSTDEVTIRIIHRGVGRITENDIMLAAASEAIVIGFGVKSDRVAREQAEHEGVQVRTYTVIYHLLEDVEQALKGKLQPTFEEITIGRAEVRAIFRVRGQPVAGCYVLEGRIVRNAKARLIRNGNVVAETKIASLKRFKEDVTEVRQGFECGVGLEGVHDLQEGDVIEVYEERQV
ncbi:MAG: hypothetical protein Q9O62_01260 [Ardenticatenia bacterium]|nr:hypothetical protein [Ardenticatenia bacterium]